MIHGRLEETSRSEVGPITPKVVLLSNVPGGGSAGPLCCRHFVR